MEHLSNRIKNMTESATLSMAAKAREFKTRGVDVINLSLGEPDFKTPKHIQVGAKEAIDTGLYFAYPPVNGYADLRNAISNKFKNENGLNYSEDQIVVSNGAKQSIVNAMMVLINPGDEVIVLSPYWVSYTAAIALAEGVPVLVKGKIDNDFKATATQIKTALTPKTRAIIFSSPCNPTGSVFTKEELVAIAEVVKSQEGVYVISDEIYEHINFSSIHTSIGSFAGMEDITITINGMAKGFAMTGWRVGYLGAPAWIAKACSKIQGQVTSANCSIAQRAALIALTSSLEPTKAMTKEYDRRRHIVYELLNAIPGVRSNMPKGAFYFFPDISSYFGKSHQGRVINNASDLCIYLLENAHVSLVTGDAFGDANCLRLSYAASEDNLRLALKKMAEALAKLK